MEPGKPERRDGEYIRNGTYSIFLFTEPYTPKHGSWLNIAEIELRVMARQCLDCMFATITALRQELSNWGIARNKKQKGVD
jgi:hypothetical protein